MVCGVCACVFERGVCGVRVCGVRMCGVCARVCVRVCVCVCVVCVCVVCVRVCVCGARAHHTAAPGVHGWVDGGQLVQHLTDDDDAGPDGADAGRQRSELTEGQSEGPAHQKHVVKQRHLTETQNQLLWTDFQIKQCGHLGFYCIVCFVIFSCLNVCVYIYIYIYIY